MHIYNIDHNSSLHIPGYVKKRFVSSYECILRRNEVLVILFYLFIYMFFYFYFYFDIKVMKKKSPINIIH